MDGTYKEDVMKRIEAKVERLIDVIGDRWPHCAGSDGIYESPRSDFWTSGFWPGILWILYDMTGNQRFKEAAWDRDERLEKWFVTETVELHHDVGFQFLPTAVLKYMITGDNDARRRGIEAANFLAGRFNPVGKFIRAWNRAPYGDDPSGWAIIDCMLNVSLLFWASKETTDPRYKHIAIQHAETTMQYGIREDGSVCHIISFNPETGEFIESLGGQGRGPDSSWSRGTAWALYGFTQMYHHTGDERFLNTAKRVAHYFIASLPEDDVPYWDFRLDSHEGEPRDSSAGAIAASGLLELVEAVSTPEKLLYQEAANRILRSLTENYATWDKSEHQALLLGATGNKPMNHCVNGSLIFGDYYYVEAFAKMNGWKQRIF